MWKTYLSILAVVGVFLGAFVYVGATLTRLSGAGARPRGSTQGVSLEAGEAIFWGKGKCHTCHSIDTKGSAVRCPNLGAAGPTGNPIGLRAELRSQERSRQTGRAMTRAGYFVETLTNPGAYVVEGFKNEMPAIWKPPINLKPDEIKAVIVYLSSLGASPVDAGELSLPEEVSRFHAQGGQAPTTGLEPLLGRFGDAKAGESLFFDTASAASCMACHRIRGKGGAVGPDLTGIAGRQPAEFIVESILEPNKVIASGFEPVEIVLVDGENISGVKKAEDARSVTVDDGMRARIIPKGKIKSMEVGASSNMPDNYRELLQARNFLDLLAYLLEQKE